MKSTIKIFLKILTAFAIFGSLVYSSRLILNTSFNTRDSDEDIILKLVFFIKDHSQLTIFLFIISIGIIYFLIKIYARFIFWFKKNNPISQTLSKYESYYSLGEYDKVLSAIKSKSIFKYSKKYNYSINRFAALIYLIEGKQKECFKCIKNALEFVKTDEMNNELLKIKLQLFISAGSINSASVILNTLKNYQMKSSSQTLTHFEALILEKQGNLEEARSKLIIAAQLYDKQNPKELFSVYNNLGRIWGLFQNHHEKILYYEKARHLISDDSTKYQHHIVYQNLIDTYLFLNNYDRYTSLLEEYSSRIAKEKKHDLLEYYNYLLQFNRQTNNLTEFKNTIELMHKNLYPLLTKKEQLASNINELKFSLNNIGIPLDLLHKIENDFTLYEDFDLHERLIAYQIIFQAITSEDGTMSLHPFEVMHKYIFNYFSNSFPKVEEYIKNEIEDFQVYDKCRLREKKVWLYNFQPCNSNNQFSLIQHKLTLIDEITEINYASGNIITALESKLNFVDECMGSLRNSLPAEQIQSLKRQMLKAFEMVESEIQPLLKHPEMPPALIRLAKYSSFFDKKDLAKKYKNKFLELNLSINHFAAYIQNYYNDVNNYLEN